MLDQLVVYSLSVYFFFHLFGRSDILAGPRGWANKVFPSALTYPLNCSFCFTWWVGVGVTVATSLYLGVFFVSPIVLLGAPVLNLLLDRAIERLNPKALSVFGTVTASGATYSTITEAPPVLKNVNSTPTPSS